MNISFSLDLMTRLVHGMRPLWLEAANLETAMLAKRLPAIECPIFISGMARGGSTLLLEFIAANDDIATHQYRDFPFIFTPYISRKFTDLFQRKIESKERAHGDKIFITPNSPEGMEEMIWMAFSNHDKDFAKFYRGHIQKLLFASKCSRYAAKNNNLIARLPTLFDIFPDARVIIPVRDPVTHIASIMRQHNRFMDLANHPRAIRHLLAQGHFEFGPTRTWHAENEIAGWANAWNDHYRPLLPYLNKENILLVPYEKICEEPSPWLIRIEQHVQLNPLRQFSQTIASRNYYDTGISNEDADNIRHITHEINSNLTQFMLH